MITHTLEFCSDQSDCPFVLVCVWGGVAFESTNTRANFQLKGVKDENVKETALTERKCWPWCGLSRSEVPPTH